MANRTDENDLAAILDAVGGQAGGKTANDIARALPDKLPRRTLQFRLKKLIDATRLVREGKGRWVRYHLPPVASASDIEGPDTRDAPGESAIPLSDAGAEIQDRIRRPIAARRPVGYDRAFLDSYKPNVSLYLSTEDHSRLTSAAQFKPSSAVNVAAVNTLRPSWREEPAAGTYAKQILNRLLIDLSWNSSRLEGNTYSLLDTRRLIEFGREAKGKDRRDAQMILNHKNAIEFLVGNAPDIGFNRYTIQNLHAALAENLLGDEAASGRLRSIPVGIEQSVFHPLEVPQLIEECFDQILAAAAAVEDPFEQAFFVMVQLPYLQPFDDVNKRVSRLAANIPLIERNLPPLSFTDVPRGVYTDALLGVYELNRIELLKDVFIWAYERSAARYAAVRQSLGAPDPFRLRHGAALKDLVGDIVRGGLDRNAAEMRIAAWTSKNISKAERERFREAAENDLLGLHEGNFARLRIRPSEFAAWLKIWSAKPP